MEETKQSNTSYEIALGNSESERNQLEEINLKLKESETLLTNSNQELNCKLEALLQEKSQLDQLKSNLEIEVKKLTEVVEAKTNEVGELKTANEKFTKESEEQKHGLEEKLQESIAKENDVQQVNMLLWSSVFF